MQFDALAWLSGMDHRVAAGKDSGRMKAGQYARSDFHTPVPEHIHRDASDQ
jgi:hypothetical protein